MGKTLRLAVMGWAILGVYGLALAAPPTLAPAPAAREPSVKPARPAPADNFPIAAPVENYAPVASATSIAPTPGTADDPNHKVEVSGVPRVVQGHPCTLWDQEDVARYKARLKTDDTLQKQLAALQAKMDQRLKRPLDVPGTHQGPDGKWLAPGDFPKNEAPYGKQGTNCQGNAATMTDLAVAYALSGDARYGQYCRKMLLAYAASYPRWGRPADSTWRSARDLRFTFQFLNDGFVLARMAWAYDLIHDLPAFTAEDRTTVDRFFRAAVTPFFVQGAAGHDYLSTKDNRSCLCAAAVLMAGYAAEDQDLVDFALHGHAGTRLQPVATEGAGPLNPRELGGTPGDKTPGGLLAVHFSADCLLPDGLWVEGAPGYTLGIAGCGLFDAAETLWRHGVDMYRYRNGALKRLLDSGLLLANPDATMTVPCLRDSGRFSLLDNRDWMNGQIGAIYHCGYRRYHEMRYLPIIQNAAAHLDLTVHSGPPLIKEDLPATAPAPAGASPSVNFYAIGYGILRIAEGDRTNSLLLQFSEEKDWAGHDHPSRLGIDLYTWGETLAPFPGVIFPYNDPLDVKWYWTTLANCAMEVDQDDQLDAGNRYHKYKGAPRPTAPQLVYAPATTLGMQRAYSSSIYPGTTQDRALFMTARYVADLFGGFCSVPRTYDLAWHFRGELKADLALAPWKFPEPVANGYNGLDNVRRAVTDTGWSAALTFHDKPLRFFATAGPQTEVIVGDGHFNGYKEHPPTIVERRSGQKCTLYGTALDLAGEKDGFLKTLAQEGGLDAGYGLLKVQTAQGTDLCFAAYRAGTYQAGGLETDAVQAMVTMDATHVQALYLGGGTTLKAGGASLERSAPGLAYVEKLRSGRYVVANPSASEATVTVTLPGVTAAQPFTMKLPGGGQVEIVVP